MNIDIEEYFVKTYNLAKSEKLSMNIELWLGACRVLTRDYNLTEEQQQLVDLLYVGCQLSSPPLFLIPPSAMLSSESVRDFSVSYAPILGSLADEAGYCGQLKKALKIFGMRNGSVNHMIVI